MGFSSSFVERAGAEVYTLARSHAIARELELLVVEFLAGAGFLFG
jgi:hypothetical protein